MARTRNFGLVAILWVLAIGLFVLLFVLYHDTRLSHRSGGFPYMPLYGAMAWGFFLVIPLIGWTWGYFNDLKDDGRHLDQRARRERERRGRSAEC
jgi:hypothetical protein